MHEFIKTKERGYEMKLETYNINLNIHYSAPREIWDKLECLYREMPNWNGFLDGCAKWYGTDEKIIEASIEPSGLQFYAKLPPEEWETWITLFKSKATELLGYEVGEPEDGFMFMYYDTDNYNEDKANDYIESEEDKYIDKEFVIYQSKKGNIIYGLGSLILCLGSVLGLILHNQYINLLYQIVLKIGCFCGVFFFGFGAIYCFKRMNKKNVFLAINEEGITDHTTAISLGFIPWKDIENVYVGTVFGEKFIELKIKYEDKYLQNLNFIKKMFIYGQKRMGHQIACITLNTTSYSISEVLTVINQFRISSSEV